VSGAGQEATDGAVRAVRAVLDIHRPTMVTAHGGVLHTVCDHCSTGDPFCTVSDDWPCPTVTAIHQHVDPLG
jgi:hypothetical protein